MTDAIQFQKDLDSLSLWEQKWKMSFNIGKCHIMHVTRNRKPIKAIYTLHNQPLSVVDQACYLGVEISSSLNWSPHVNKICSKASQSLGFLKRNIHSSKS